MVELLRTYSRGGWVAFLAGLGIFLLSLKSGRRVPLLMLGLFLALLLLLPNGLSRADPVAGGVDRSVGNRWLVWKGALTMTSDHWLGGVGSGEFGTQFTPWYQPIKMTTRYVAALNNYLTLSAERGILVLWGYLCLVFGILYTAWRKSRQTQNAWMLGVVSAQVVYLVAGLFTYSLTKWEVAWIFWTFFVVSSWHIVKNLRNSWRQRLAFPKPNAPPFLAFLTPIGASTLICLLILFSGSRLLAELSTRADFFIFNETGQQQHGVIVSPTRNDARGVIIWSHGKGGSIREDGKDTLRYLAEKGFIVVSIDYRDGGMDGLEDIRALLRWVLHNKEFESYPMYLAGFSLGARLSILAACYDPDPRLKAVASIGSAATWPFPEISPEEHLYDLKCPLLIIHGEEDRVNSVAQAYELERLCKRYRKSHELFIVEGASHYLNEEDQWFTALDRIAAFVDKH